MGNCPGAIDVTTQFLRVTFADENTALPPKRAAADVFCDLPRRPIVVTDFINGVYSIYTGGKMERCGLQLRIDLGDSAARSVLHLEIRAADGCCLHKKKVARRK